MNKPVEYEQTDKRWKNIPYTITGSKTQTIGTSGCAPTCAAMVLATLKGNGFQPPAAAKWAVDHGYRTKNDGTAWGFFAAYFKEYGIAVQQTGDVSVALNALKNGYMVIAAAGKGIWTSGGHFILAWGFDQANRKIMIHDPNSEAEYREVANYNNFIKECTQFWVIRERWEDKLEKKNVSVNNLDTKEMVTVEAVNVDGANYIKLRDIEKLFPVTVDWDGHTPTMKMNYKK